MTLELKAKTPPQDREPIADADLNLVDDWYPETSEWADQEPWDGE